MTGLFKLLAAYFPTFAKWFTRKQVAPPTAFTATEVTTVLPARERTRAQQARVKSDVALQPASLQNAVTFQIITPPRKPYVYVATGKLFATGAIHYLRIRPYYGDSDPIQGVISDSREFIQTLLESERREDNRQLWSQLCLATTPTHVIHIGYVNESRTHNWDLLYLAVHLHGHPLHYASTIALEIGDFLLGFLQAEAEEITQRGMLVVKPGSAASQVFWLTLLFVKYRALMFGDSSIGRGGDGKH